MQQSLAIRSMLGSKDSIVISTAFVESTINQVVSRRFVKKQQMQWTLRNAHLLLQTRTRGLRWHHGDMACSKKGVGSAIECH